MGQLGAKDFNESTSLDIAAEEVNHKIVSTFLRIGA